MTPKDEALTRSVIPIAVAVFLSASAAVGAALIAVDAARPGHDDLQRAALDELGLPTSLLDAPGAQTIADEFSDRIVDRTVDEAMPSLALGAAAGIATGAAAALASATVLVKNRTTPRGDQGMGE